jgi:hypothetical protein
VLLAYFSFSVMHFCGSVLPITVEIVSIFTESYLHKLKSVKAKKVNQKVIQSVTIQGHMIVLPQNITKVLLETEMLTLSRL